MCIDSTINISKGNSNLGQVFWLDGIMINITYFLFCVMLHKFIVKVTNMVLLYCKIIINIIIFEYMWIVDASKFCFRFHPNLILGGTYSGQIVLWDNRVQKRTPIQRTPLSTAAHTVGGVDVSASELE